MKIYTKRGDAGQTDLFGGGRVAKDHERVMAYGAVDELNASVGSAAAESGHDDLRKLCHRIQSTLFDVGAYLATPDAARREKAGIRAPDAEEVLDLENAIDALEDELEPLRTFILPGGTRAAAAFHVARTVCRRAERAVVALHAGHPVGEEALRYLNRLSDLLFTIARVENARSGVSDIRWEGRRD